MRKLLLATLALSALAGAAEAQPYRPPVPGVRVEVRPPMPRPGYVWRPGYWNWAGGRYAWVGGVWIAPGVPGYGGGQWVPGHWNRWGAWVPAHWR